MLANLFCVLQLKKGHLRESDIFQSVNHLELEFSADSGYRTEVFNSVVNKLMNLSAP